MNTKIKILQLKRNPFRRAQVLCVSSLILFLVASPAGISTATPLNRFRILIDTNQLNYSEITSGVGSLAADGVWAVTQNHCGLDCGCAANPGFSQNSPDVPPSSWPGVMAALNAANKLAM